MKIIKDDLDCNASDRSEAKKATAILRTLTICPNLSQSSTNSKRQIWQTSQHTHAHAHSPVIWPVTWNGKFAFSVLRFHVKKPFLSSQQSYVLTKKVKKGQWNIPRARACMGLGFEKKERKTQNQGDFGSPGLQWYAMWNLGRANIPHFLVARPLRKKAFETSVSVRHRTSSDVFNVRREKGQRPFAQGL